mgnify:CR=1 FL=1
MVIILFLTYIFIKAKAPKLHQDHHGNSFMKGLMVMVISWVVVVLASGAYGFGRGYTKVEEYLITQLTFQTFCNVIVPLYFIVSTPNLHEYAKGLLGKTFKPPIVLPLQMVPSPPMIVVTFHT